MTRINKVMKPESHRVVNRGLIAEPELLTFQVGSFFICADDINLSLGTTSEDWQFWLFVEQWDFGISYSHLFR